MAAQDTQDTQDKQDNKGGLGGVLDTLGNVLGTGTQKLHGAMVANEGSTFVLRTDDHRTYRVDAASLDPQKVRALTPGQTVSVTAHGGGQAGVLTATDVTPDAKGGGKAFQAVTGTVQETGRQRVLFKTRDGLVLPVDVSNINGLPYLALQTSDGRSVVVDTSGVDRQSLRAIGPGDTVTVTGKSGASSGRFVAQSVQLKR